MARELFAFPDTTFVENLVVHSNGNLLLTTFTEHLYSLDPAAATPIPEIVATLPGVDALSGIALIAPDVYAVSGGHHLSFSFANGSMRVFTVDFRPKTHGGPVDVKESAQVPNTQMLNGMTPLPRKKHIVLSGDSIGGRMFHINTLTGKADVAFTDPSLEPGDKATVPLGVNGVKVFEDMLYFTNSAKGIFARVKIDDNGNKVGDVEVLATIPDTKGWTSAYRWIAYDDLVIDSHGTAYVALHGNAVTKIDRGGRQSVVIGGGNSTFLKEPTSVALSADERKIYVTTGGSKINGKAYGGQIVEVKL